MKRKVKHPDHGAINEHKAMAMGLYVPDNFHTDDVGLKGNKPLANAPGRERAFPSHHQRKPIPGHK